MKHPTHKLLNAAYLFYYASDVMFSPGGSSDDAATHEMKSRSRLGERLNNLVGDILTIAQQVNHDPLH
jgi:glycylpeptide N-tetradecanoyltransferase